MTEWEETRLDTLVLKDLSEGMSADLKEEKERTMKQSGITKSR